MIISILATVILILGDEVLEDRVLEDRVLDGGVLGDRVLDDGAKRLYISELLDGFGPPERAGLQVL
ncbi:hypothetical protein [Methanothrix sp.]|jgi:hypothetical protein|uniref:hypothetical protein n=1 Tax=Methanothrix sp. TaxID=90426 RepID=UPI001BD1FCDE